MLKLNMRIYTAAALVPHKTAETQEGDHKNLADS